MLKLQLRRRGGRTQKMLTSKENDGILQSRVPTLRAIHSQRTLAIAVLLILLAPFDTRDTLQLVTEATFLERQVSAVH